MIFSNHARTPIIPMIKTKALLAASGSFLAFAAAPISGAIILLVDPSDLSAVSFIATSAFAENTNSDTLVFIGIELEGIAEGTANPFGTAISPTSSNLVPGGSDAIDEIQNTAAVTGLNLYRTADAAVESMVFATDSPALTGSLTVDFSTQNYPFKPVGTIGDIRVGDGIQGSGVLIGQYQIIPEPTTSILCLGGFAGFLLRRHRNV